MKFGTSALVCVGVLATETCYLPVDLMVLQDTTGSFVENLPIVAKQIPTLVEKVLEQNPGSLFGAAEHKDKPYRDMGEPDDFCYRLTQPLTSDVATFQKSYATLYASGGGDLPEAQLHAFINIVQDANVGWRNLAAVGTRATDLTTQTGARLIVLSTDAVPHDPGDYNLYNGVDFPDYIADYPSPPLNMPTLPTDPSSISITEQCTVYDYPGMAKAAAILKGADVKVVFLVPENETDAVEKWSLFNQMYLGQPSSFLQYIQSDSSDFVSVVLNALHEVTQYVCSTTTTTSTTTAATTAVATTATATSQATTEATTVASTAPTEATTTVATTKATEATVTTAGATVTTAGATVTTAGATVTTAGATVTTAGATVVTTKGDEVTTTATTQEATAITTKNTHNTITSTTGTSTEASVTKNTEETTAGSQTTADTASNDDECHCPPEHDDCECQQALYIRVNQRPKHLVVDYEA